MTGLDVMLSAAVALADRSGLELTGAEVVRVAPVCGARAVWSSPDGDVPVWLRFANPAAAEQLGRELAAAAAASRGPSLAVVPAVHGEVLVDGTVAASVWHAADPAPPRPAYALAGAVAALHLSSPPGQTLSWGRDVTAWLLAARDAGALAARDADTLLSGFLPLFQRLSRQPGPLGVGACHGDAWGENLLSIGGTPVLCDLATAGAGPRVCDVVPLWVLHRRYGAPRWAAMEFLARYRQLAAPTYEVHLDTAFPAALRCYEVWRCAWVWDAALSGDPAALDEAMLRTASLLGGGPSRWTAL